MTNDQATGSNNSSGSGIIIQSASAPEFTPATESWHIWKEKLDIHLCEINCTQENIKKAILLKSIGSEPYKLLHSLCSPASPVCKTFKELCEILQTHYTPPTIIFYEGKKFHMSVKNNEETVSQWYARVKQLALDCKFGAHLEAFVLN